MDSPIAYLISAWLIGLIQLGLGETLTHEAAHGNLFRTKRLNQLSELVCCLPFFFTLKDYKREHSEHHRLLNTDRERLHQDYSDHGLLKSDRNMVWLWFFKPVLGYGAYSYIRSVITLATYQSFLKIFLFWSVLLMAASWGGWLDLLFLYWIIPMLWCFASFFYWSEIEDHYNTVSGTRTNIGWVNWLTHNNGYHDVHHRYPYIPWYLLKKAHHRFCADSPDISRGFFDTFRQITRNNNSSATEEALSERVLQNQS